ncbi:MAG: nitroreductase [Chloroflexi bacterium]|nr:nitroreductase [Chloroflexota bacterium]
MQTERHLDITLVEAIHQRQSIRAFRPTPVPKQRLMEIIETARHAPSWGNTQPWEFAVVTGEPLARIKKGFELASEKSNWNPDINPPENFPEPYDTRRREIGRKMLEIKGIAREDTVRRRWWALQTMQLFGAPAAIYIYTDRGYMLQGRTEPSNIWPAFDCGMVAQNIMLLAVGHGLGTIAEIRAVSYPNVLREVLGLPDSKVFVLGLAIGYPDMGDPINRYRSPKEPVDAFTKWYGFSEPSKR